MASLGDMLKVIESRFASCQSLIVPPTMFEPNKCGHKNTSPTTHIYIILQGKIMNGWTDGRKDGWTMIMIMIMTDRQMGAVNR